MSCGLRTGFGPTSPRALSRPSDGVDVPRMGREPLAEVDELFEQGLLPDHRKSEGVNDLHGLGWSTHETPLFRAGNCAAHSRNQMNFSSNAAIEAPHVELRQAWTPIGMGIRSRHRVCRAKLTHSPTITSA